MQTTADKEKLLPTLIMTGSVVEKRQTLPILSHLHLRLKDGTLRVVGTDIEVEISDKITNVAGEDGEFTAPTQKILDIVRMRTEGEEITLKQDKETVVITCGRSRYKLKSLPAEDFPMADTEGWSERFKVSQRTLKTVLDRTAFAMASQDVRYYLNGLLLELRDKRLRATATDGHRLAQTEVDIDLSLKEEKQMIVPRKAVAEILRFVGGDDDAEEDADDAELTVEFNDKHLKITKNQTELVTKLIDGKFPEFKGALEKETKSTSIVDREEFIAALSRAALLTAKTDRFRGVQVEFEDGLLRITGKNMEQEEAVEEMSSEHKGDAVRSGYNVDYLISAARAGDTEQLELHLEGLDGLCIIRQPGDERTIWLIMPMRL